MATAEFTDRDKITDQQLEAMIAEQGLWLGRKIPLLCIAGKIHSGKTMFPLGIDPNCFDFSKPKTTRVYDLEGSAETYAGQRNFEWIDLARRCRSTPPSTPSCGGEMTSSPCPKTRSA